VPTADELTALETERSLDSEDEADDADDDGADSSSDTDGN
jgi:hypothetical protein